MFLQQTKKIFTSIWIIALLIAVPVIAFFPQLFEKYTIKELSREHKLQLFKNSIIYYADLNGDGNKQRIQVGELVVNQEEKIVVEYNEHSPAILFKGTGFKPAPIRLYLSDTDNNGLEEIFGFSFSKDSLFLNYSEPYKPELKRYSSRSESFFVPFLYPQDEKYMRTGIDDGLFYDIDGDGLEEFIFSIKYYGDTYRMSVFIFDIQEKIFLNSEIIGDRNTRIQLFDVDNDGRKEIIADGSGTPTSNRLYDLSDTYPHLKIYSPDLEFKIAPKKFRQGIINTIPIRFASETYLYTIWRGISNKSNFVLYKIDNNGNTLDSLSITCNEPSFFPWIGKNNDNEILLNVENGQIAVYSNDLKLKETIIFSEFSEVLFFTEEADINEDGIIDYLYKNAKTDESIILTDNFRKRISYAEGQTVYSFYNAKIAKNTFYDFDEKYSYIYDFRKNPYRFLAIPIYLMIYLFSVLLVFVIRKTQEASLKEKYELRNRVRDLQLTALKNQLDPHFMYNTFNTIASVVKQGRNEEAYDVIVQFSKMVRKNLEGSGDIYTSLKEELEFVKEYLYIQKFRFKEMFEYHIVIGKGVNQSIRIPRLLMQIHIENALKHGLRMKKPQGILKVNIQQEKEFVVVELEDNGIGRKKSKQYKTGGTGIGLKTIEQIIEINNQSRENRITQTIIDLHDEHGDSRGTKVVLKIWT